MPLDSFASLYSEGFLSLSSSIFSDRESHFLTSQDSIRASSSFVIVYGILVFMHNILL